jgi:TolB protein
MTTPTRLERTLPSILDDLAAGPYPDYIDDALMRTGRMRQRPAWAFPERWLPMDFATRIAPVNRLPLRQIGILALIAILLAVALAVAVGSQRRVPAPFGPARNGLIPYIAAGDVYLGDPATGQTRAVVTGPAVESVPGFSPDGTKLAFSRDAGGSAVDEFVAHPDGSAAVRITPTPLASVVASSWAPDGRHIAMIHPVDGVNRFDLFDVEGKVAPTRLDAATNADSIQFRPPLGAEILFRALVNGRYGLFVMNADGTHLRTLVKPTNTADVDQDLNAAVYSADGSRIFYQRWTPDSIQLWVMSADGSDPREFRPEPGQGWDGLADPSPDGRWVAYWHVIEDGRATQHVSVVRADGTGPLIETGPAMTGTARWTWSPDSTRILMLPNDGSSPSAYLLDPAGGQWTTVQWQADQDMDWQRLAFE